MFLRFRTVLVLCLLIPLFEMCHPPTQTTTSSQLLEEIMRQQPAVFSRALEQRSNLRIQILYTQIDRDASNKPHFKTHAFQENSGAYFYPASTVKMPLAFLALEKRNRLGIPRSATMITEKMGEWQTAVYNDPTAVDGRPTLEHYIKKVFLVSDNDASNRLYEFLGQQYLHDQLKQKGYPNAQILHRLSLPLPDAANRHTNPVSFFDVGGKLLLKQPAVVSTYNYLQRTDSVGKGYMQEGKLVNGPMDFSTKNRFYLRDLHELLQRVIFPEAFPKHQQFQFSEEDYRFLYQYMSQLPSETRFPAYDPKEYFDGYVKFFMFGTKKEASIPKHIRIFNKVGWAYGFLTDVAYIVDFEKKIEFFLSATIYCNSDEILNDDQYEFDSVGMPFLEQLGEAVYQYELKRKRRHVPDLSRFVLNYEK